MNFGFSFEIFSHIFLLDRHKIRILIQVSDYLRDLKEMQLVSKEEYLASLRRHAYISTEWISLLFDYSSVTLFYFSGKVVLFQKDSPDVGLYLGTPPISIICSKFDSLYFSFVKNRKSFEA